MYQAHLDAEDEQIKAENDRLRFFPDDLQCAPTFKHFETALQHSLNATTVKALVYLDRKDKRKVHLDTLGGQVKSGQSWTGQIRPVAPGRFRVARDGLGVQVAL
jgi:hypothetical protein